MKMFKDTKGRSWTVSIDVSTVKRVRGLIGVDLFDVIGGKLIDRLVSDPVLLGDVLYAVCKPQADAQSVSDVEFGEGLAGDAIDSATQALLDELVSFCPSPRDRAALGLVLDKTRAAMDRARDVIDERIASGQVDRAIDDALRPILNPPPAAPPGAPPGAPPESEHGISSGSARASPE